MSNQYDVVVIGGGPIGLSSAYHCAKAGKSVLLLERFNFFNQSGSSNDLVRMFRTMYTQDFMANLAFQSIEVWQDLQVDGGESLIWMSGLLNFGDPNYQSGPEGNLMDPIKNMERLGLPYKILNVTEIMKQYPFRKLPSNFHWRFRPNERMHQRAAAVAHSLPPGASLRRQTRVACGSGGLQGKRERRQRHFRQWRD
jgi:sarcosine oxidase/L-pipecolate oxidase